MNTSSLRLTTPASVCFPPTAPLQWDSVVLLLWLCSFCWATRCTGCASRRGVVCVTRGDGQGPLSLSAAASARVLHASIPRVQHAAAAMGCGVPRHDRIRSVCWFGLECTDRDVTCATLAAARVLFSVSIHPYVFLVLFFLLTT